MCKAWVECLGRVVGNRCSRAAFTGNRLEASGYRAQQRAAWPCSKLRPYTIGRHTGLSPL